MNSIGRLTIGAIGALLILSPWNGNAQTCLPSVAQSLGTDPHHTAIAGGPGKGGTQLAAHDVICITSANSQRSLAAALPFGYKQQHRELFRAVEQSDGMALDFLNAVAAGHLPGVVDWGLLSAGRFRNHLRHADRRDERHRQQQSWRPLVRPA